MSCNAFLLHPHEGVSAKIYMQITEKGCKEQDKSSRSSSTRRPSWCTGKEYWTLTSLLPTCSNSTNVAVSSDVDVEYSFATIALRANSSTPIMRFQFWLRIKTIYITYSSRLAAMQRRTKTMIAQRRWQNSRRSHDDSHQGRRSTVSLNPRAHGTRRITSWS